jgi:glycerophosphoryl diester phosphodiesterase
MIIEKQFPKTKTMIIGHRGAKAYEPENTLRSFEAAIQMGVDMVELDVHVLPGGEVVLMHDNKINRTTNGEGYIFEQTYDVVRKLDAGQGEHIPTLQEVLDLVNRRVLVNIELKGPGTATAVAVIIKDYIAHKGWKPSDFLVSSFNHPELVEFHHLCRSIKIAALTSVVPLGYAEFAQEMGAVAINPDREFVSQKLVDDAHKRGLKVYVHTVDDSDDIERMVMMGVDGIFTNCPDIARHVAAFAEATPRSEPYLRFAAA